MLGLGVSGGLRGLGGFGGLRVESSGVYESLGFELCGFFTSKVGSPF